MTVAGDHGSSWESLTPFEKAREWRDVYPDLAAEVMGLGRVRAEMVWELEKEGIRHKNRLEEEAQQHRLRLESERLRQEGLNSRRLWITQLIALAVAILSTLANAVIAQKYASSGNVLPGLSIFGAGGVLAGSSYLIVRSATNLERCSGSNDLASKERSIVERKEKKS